MKKGWIIAGAAAFWILVWYILARIVGQPLLLPSPERVLVRLGGMIVTGDFWVTTGWSIFRVLAGIVSAVVLGVLLAMLTEASVPARVLFSPLMTLVKSTPVASFIILALIWLGRTVLPAVITGLIVLPVVWTNVSAGIRNRDPLLLEMARVYQMPRRRIWRRITIPSVMPHFKAALTASLGMGWKAGIAAEVLTVPRHSMGKMIYESKLYLETTDLFAWTLTVIIISLVIEKLVLRLVSRIGSRTERAVK